MANPSKHLKWERGWRQILGIKWTQKKAGTETQLWEMIDKWNIINFWHIKRKSENCLQDEFIQGTMLEEECLIMNRTKYGNSNATVKQNNSMEKSGPRCSQISEREWLKTAIPEEIICANQGFLLSKSVLIGFYYTFTHWQVQLMPFYHFFCHRFFAANCHHSSQLSHCTYILFQSLKWLTELQTICEPRNQRTIEQFWVQIQTQGLLFYTYIYSISFKCNV